MTGRRQPSLPPRITGFEYIGLIGMGGFADVFEYRQDFPRRSVAVKVLLDSSLDAGNRDAFFAEANIMAGLSQHPSIVTIHQAAISSDGRPYFIMEHCARPSLGARFRTERISVAETLRTGIRVASAVETAHRLGILHRDIKPANILATDFGWPALTDFGIAGAVGEQLVASGMSIPWAPPELLADEPFGDARSDVYSLAATLYSLLAGRSPFEVPGGRNAPIDLITRIERDQLRPIERVDVPQSLNLVIARAMAKEPDQRFSSAVAFAHALQGIEREMQLPVTGIDVIDLPTPKVHNTGPSGQTQPPAQQHPTGQQPDSSGSGLRAASPADVVDETTGSDEATRVRGITTVSPEPAVEQPHGSDVETRLRPVVTINTEEPVAETPPAVQPQGWSPIAAREALERAFEPKEFDDTTGNQGYFYEKRKEADAKIRGLNKRLTILISLASVLVLVAVLVFIGNRALGGRNGEVPTQQTETATPSIDTASVPAVTNLRVASQSESNVRFEWKNPNPQDGDAYIWRIVDVDSHGTNTRIDKPFVVVPREAPDSQICIEVSLVRTNGKMSNTPSRECTP